MDNFCPKCDNHCPKESLKCGRGMKHFGLKPEGGQHGFDERDISQMGTDDAVIMLMRKCGHYLHHSAGHEADGGALLSALSEEEKRQLLQLLKKCSDGWK